MPVSRGDLRWAVRTLSRRPPHDRTISAGLRLQDAAVREGRVALWMLFGAVGCVVLIACANIANLSRANATARHREISIRAALGASGARLARQVLTENLLLAILAALEQVGDEAAVPYVKRLADSRAITREQRRIQQKAEACLPYLESCANQRRGSQTLLRASSIDSTRPEILLRPASGNTDTEPEQLLRAGIQSEGL